MKCLPYILMLLALCAVTAGLCTSPGAVRVRDRVSLAAAGGRLPPGPAIAPIPAMYEPIGWGVDAGDATGIIPLPGNSRLSLAGAYVRPELLGGVFSIQAEGVVVPSPGGGIVLSAVPLPLPQGPFDFEHVEKSDPLLAGVYFDGEPAKLKPPKLNRWSRISLGELRQKVWLSWGN